LNSNLKHLKFKKFKTSLLDSEHHQLTIYSDEDERKRQHRQHFATFPLIRRTPTTTSRTTPSNIAADVHTTDAIITMPTQGSF